MPYYILGLYIKTFCGSLVVEKSVGGIRCEGSSVSFIPVKKSFPGERALVALSPTLESLVLVCTAISPSNPLSSLLFGAGGRVGVTPSLCDKCHACYLILTPTFEDSDFATDPLLLQDLGWPWSASHSSAFLT
jgi:hypothetical protein